MSERTASEIGRQNRRMGADVERRVAALMGGKRSVMSGGSHLGGGDLTFMPDNIFADFSWEVKRRAKTPQIIREALAQAQVEIQATGARKMPAAIIVSAGIGPANVDKAVVAMQLGDFVNWTQALAEVGQSADLKARVRAIIRDLKEMEARL